MSEAMSLPRHDDLDDPIDYTTLRDDYWALWDAASAAGQPTLTDAEREALRGMLPTIMYEPHRQAIESILERLG